MSKAVLKVEGTRITDGDGKEVILRGAGLGGWMNMENFISGYPGAESDIRAALAEVIGDAKSDFFFDKFLEYFFQDADAVFFKSSGLNCIRIAFNYRHFEDDMNPRVLKTGGFKHLDRVIDICAKHGIYTILDLHSLPGGQNQGWHSDAGSHIANFWLHKDFQDRGIWLWEELAKHYQGNPWIAGYNIMNEPADPYQTRLIDWYNRAIKAIRAIDAEHIIFLDGNTYASDFTHFGEAYKAWTNVSYSIHDYSPFGFPQRTEPYEGTDAQRDRIHRMYQAKRAWCDERGLCVWNGEWGPVYARTQYDGDATEQTNERRYQVLKAQLANYNKDRLSWSIWLYKDVGFQGMVHVKLDTPYMMLLKDFLAKKHRMAVDVWGADDTHVRHIYQPLVDHIKAEVAPEHQDLYPFPVWKLQNRVNKLTRELLVGQFLVREWAEHFVGKSEADLDALARSFAFENCNLRDSLNKVLSENATLVAHHNE